MVSQEKARIVQYMDEHTSQTERTAGAICLALGISKAQWEVLIYELLQEGLIVSDGDWAYQITLEGMAVLKSDSITAAIAIPGEGIRKTVTDWSRVRPYVLPDVYQQIQDARPDQRPALCQENLNQLLTAVTTYLPHHLALQLLKNPHPPRQQVSGHFMEGTLLFADISGFTALSEKLRRKVDKQGAEELVRLINEYLDVMLEILFRNQGQLIKFGGDAMLGLFTGTRQGALNGVRAAWEMKQAMAERFSQVEVYQEIFSLEMKVGSNSGLLFAATVGNDEHMEYILTGRAVEQTAHAESAAHQGEILVSQETLQLVKDSLRFEPVSDTPGFYRVVGLKSQIPSGQFTTWHVIETTLETGKEDVELLLDRLDALTPYLPAGVLTQMIYNPTQQQVEGQHRQVTVLFANFICMSEVIQSLGIENPQAITAELNHYFQTMQEEIQYYGGMINKVDLYDTGDKLMVVFGAPTAHERDTTRAALTALAMQRAMDRLSTPSAQALSQRIGVHTGFVFAGTVGSSLCKRREYTVMGDTVNKAARLMSNAPVGKIWISTEVQEEIKQSFAIEELPPIDLKGIGKTPVYELNGSLLTTESLLTGSLAVERSLSAELVGRENEIGRLCDLVQNLGKASGIPVISITGEGGVGKTRLVGEWMRSVEESNRFAVTWLKGYGKLYGQKTNGIFSEVFENLFGFREEDKLENRMDKLSAYLEKRFKSVEMHRAYLAQFLSLDVSGYPDWQRPLADLDAGDLQMQIRLTLCDVLSQEANDKPLVLILEDLQWSDEASLDLLQFLLDHLSDDLPILFCLTYRPQKEHLIWQVWQELVRKFPDCSQIALAELNFENGKQLLSKLLDSDQLPDGFQEKVYRATDGNPLYIQEVLNTLIKDGLLVRNERGWQLNQNIEAIKVPTSLFQIIQSRIDELDFSSPGARRVLWMAAIAGDEFNEEVLSHLFNSTGHPKDEFLRHMRELRNAGMVERIIPVASERMHYRFRHGLLRQVAYENMLLSKRREYHTLVGGWLEDNHITDRSRYLGDLAEHFDRGEAWEKAVMYHRQAGEQDARVYENQRARWHFQRALEIAPKTHLDDESMGNLRLDLGKVLSVSGEYDQALQQLGVAYDLFSQISTADAAQSRAYAGYEIARVHERKGGRENYSVALDWLEKSLSILPGEPTPAAAKLHALGCLLGQRTHDYALAEREGETALRLAESVQTDLAFIHRVLSITSHAQGKLVEAMRHCSSAIAISEATGELAGLAIALSNQGVVAWEMNDWSLAGRAYARALEIQERIGDIYQMAMTCCNLGDLYCHSGELEAGLTFTRKGLEAYKQIDSPQGKVFALTVLATLHWRGGAFEQAQRDLHEAQLQVEEHEVSDFQAMVTRWLAQVLLSQGEWEAAESEVRKLIDMTPDELGADAEPAQRLHARLLARRGRLEEAIRILEESLGRLEARDEQYEVALTRLALAETLVLHGDRAANRKHAEKALVVFEALGAQPDILLARGYL